jgi:hypothetical protein
MTENKKPSNHACFAAEAKGIEGDRLVAVMQASPHRHLDIIPKREAMPVRKVKL